MGLKWFCFHVLTITAGFSGLVQGQQQCTNEKIDLVFVLDSSGSIRDNNPDDRSYDNWELLLEFVVSLVSHLEIGVNDTRVGVVKYSQEAESSIYLDQLSDRTELINEIRQISYLGSHTNTSGGIREMHYTQFTEAHGDRLDIPNIAIVITDGVSTIDVNLTEPDARAARNDGIRIYAFGIGDAVSADELRDISSAPQQLNRNYFIAVDFTILDDPEFIEEFASETCLQQPDPINIENYCVSVKLDLVFVFDSSGSIRDGNPADGSYDNYDLLLEFAVSIVDRLEIGDNDTRVGVIVYSDTARNVFYLNDYADKNSLKVELRTGVPYIGGNTNTSGALREMQFEQFTNPRGDRPEVPNVAILITDGQSTLDVDRTLSDAERARAAGIQIVSVGVTSRIDEDELKGISSQPQQLNRNYYKSVNFTSLDDLVDSILQQACLQSVAPSPCLDNKADIVFVLDSSGSIRDNNPDDGSYDNYELLLDFVVAIVNELTIGSGQTRVGVVVFGNSGESVIFLNQYYDKQRLIAAIRSIDYVGGNTNTSGALRVMRKEQFTSANGDRSSAANIAIVITDGVSTVDTDRTISEADSAKRRGVKIYAVGITDEIDETELRKISSSPRRLNRNYFTSADFTILDNIVSALLSEACETPQLQDDGPEVDFCVEDKTDVVFVLDSSGSIRDNNPLDGSYDNWELMLGFVNAIIDSLLIGKDKIRVGVVRYSAFANNEFYLDTYRDRYSLREAIRNIPYIGSLTNTSGGIRLMHKEQFTKKHGDRENVDNVAIVITDGASTVDENRVIKDAKKARKDEITIFTVGITDDINEKELRRISSSPHKKNKNYFLTSDFETLNEMKIIVKCEEKEYNALLYGMLAVAAAGLLVLLRLTCLFCKQMTKKYDDEEKERLTTDRI